LDELDDDVGGGVDCAVDCLVLEVVDCMELEVVELISDVSLVGI
jgi:hypothetical protein